MIKMNEFRAQLSNVCIDSGRPLLIGPKNAPPQWVGALENWCGDAPEKERVYRLEAAKRVLQHYANPQNNILDLSRTSLIPLPPDLSGLADREKLKLGQNLRLQALPPDLGLTSLPPGLSHLANLEKLNVSQNLGLQALPDDLGECAKLNCIDASSCSINEWPTWLSRLPLLRTLVLDDNPGLRVSAEQIRECLKLKNLSMEATMPRDFKDPPRRHLPSGEARGRAMVRSASPSPLRSHHNSRTRSASPPPHATAPSVANMLGANEAYQLDKDFGSLQWPFRRGEPALKPWELDAAEAPLMLNDRIFVPDEKGHFANLATLLDLEKLRTGEKKYIWTISKSGRLIISEERQANDHNAQHAREPQYIGHPAQVGGGRGRISGELLFQADRNDPLSGKFYINNASGRFSKFADRNEMQLKRVAKLFRKAGLAVETVYRQRDKLQSVYGWQVSDQDNEPILPDKK